MITALAFLKDLAIGYASYRKSLRLFLTCSGISPVYMWLCSKGTQQWTLSVCYVHSPPPPRFVLCCCCYHHHHHHHQTNFIHIHGRSLYIRSLAFECCNIALVTSCIPHHDYPIAKPYRRIRYAPLPSPHYEKGVGSS